MEQGLRTIGSRAKKLTSSSGGTAGKAPRSAEGSANGEAAVAVAEHPANAARKSGNHRMCVMKFIV
jgi:hypothetical protein